MGAGTAVQQLHQVGDPVGTARCLPFFGERMLGSWIRATSPDFHVFSISSVNHLSTFSSSSNTNHLPLLLHFLPTNLSIQKEFLWNQFPFASHDVPTMLKVVIK